MRQLTVKTSTSEKGRSFSAIELACVAADSLWEEGRTSTNNVRPVWIMLTGSDNELRSFVANLRTGKKAEVPNGYSRRNKECVELLKSVGYQYFWQRMPEGSVVTAFLPDLFAMDPGMVDPAGIKFVLLPTRKYIESQALDTELAVNHVRELFDLPKDLDIASMVPIAALFAAYLDRRTRCPLVSDIRFYLQIYLDCLARGFATWSKEAHSYSREFGRNSPISYMESGTETVGLLPGVAFSATHENFEKVLADQVKLFFEATR